MKNFTYISQNVIRRLPRYLRKLHELAREGEQELPPEELEPELDPEEDEDDIDEKVEAYRQALLLERGTEESGAS